jgi:hypothetical protein
LKESRKDRGKKLKEKETVFFLYSLRAFALLFWNSSKYETGDARAAN